MVTSKWNDTRQNAVNRAGHTMNGQCILAVVMSHRKAPGLTQRVLIEVTSKLSLKNGREFIVDVSVC